MAGSGPSTQISHLSPEALSPDSQMGPTIPRLQLHSPGLQTATADDSKDALQEGKMKTGVNLLSTLPLKVDSRRTRFSFLLYQKAESTSPQVWNS